MQDRKIEWKKPFWIGEKYQKPVDNVENMEKPFVIQSVPETTSLNKNAAKKRKMEEEILDNQLPRRCVRPFYRITEGTAALAQIICNSCLPVVGDMTNVVPYIEVALEECKRSGQQLPALLPGSKKSGTGMLNFQLRLLGRTMTIYDTEQGERAENSYKIQIAVINKSGIIKDFLAVVAGDKVKGVEWLKKATRSLATLPRGKDEQSEYQELVQACIETDEVPEEFVYPRAGWRNVPGCGWRYVYGDGMIGGGNIARVVVGPYDLNINEEQVGNEETFYLAINMRNICRNNVASTELLLYTHAAVLRTLFEVAGHPLDFVFGLMGVTNSRKTSLALAMTKLFNRDKLVADAEFATATNCGIEKTLSMYGDSVVLVDDFKPGVNKLQQREMDRKLDELVRFYGNRVSKKRMTDFMAEGEKKFFPIGGGCVLTMEILTGVTSSLTRIFVTELGLHDVDNDKLRIYQENVWILSTHMYDFIYWVTKNFEKILGYIHELYPRWRQQYSSEIGRFSGMYGHMMTTANLIASYATGRGFWQKEEAEEFVKDTKNILIGELKCMESRLKRSDKSRVIIRAFIEGVQELSLVPLVLNVETSGKKADFYEDDNNYYIQARKLRQVAEEYCRKYHERAEFVSDDEMLGLLEKIGVLDVLEKQGGRERSRKLPIQKGNAKRYLYLKKSRLQEVENS